MTNITEYLKANPYPGRGIALGLSQDGQHAYIAYFIMGRSANSRNRVFARQGDGLVTKAADESKLEDPSLIIYAPVRRHAEHTIVTNGDQTDTILDYLEKGDTFENALRTRTFEPDAPNFTPRISGLLTLGYGGFSYRLSILKSPDRGQSLQRSFWEYPQPQPGIGHFIHTYAQNADPLPPFTGEPVPFRVDGSLVTFGESLWEALNPDNKISLFVRSVSLSGEESTQMHNKYTCS